MVGIGADATVFSVAHATRDPSYAWTTTALPDTSADVPPVSTETVPLVDPDAVDVYWTVVHGSDVTAPVK
jgi:hypothetical protein